MLNRWLTTGMAVRAVAAVALLIGLVQFANATLGQQSRWKGGGFGMYTEPHPLNRHVWAVLTDTQGQRHAVPLWPVADALRAQVNEETRETASALEPALQRAYELATSGDSDAVPDIIDIVQNVPWRRSADGAPVLGGDTPFQITRVDVESYEMRFDIAGRQIAMHPLNGGGE